MSVAVFGEESQILTERVYFLPRPCTVISTNHGLLLSGYVMRWSRAPNSHSKVKGRAVHGLLTSRL